MNKILVAALAALFAFTLAPAASPILTGLKLIPGGIRAEQALPCGKKYELPAFTVINTGTSAAEVLVTVEKTQRPGRTAAEPGWFSISPQRFIIQPGGEQRVKITISVPPEVAPGDYAVGIRAVSALEASATFIGGVQGHFLFSTTYSDLPDNHWAHDAVMLLVKLNAPVGYNDGSFRPQKPITGGELMGFLAAALPEQKAVVNTLLQKTDRPVNRYEAARILCLAAGIKRKTAGKDGTWINLATTHGLLSGYPDGSFRPDNHLTRAEAAVAVARLHSRLKK